MKLADIPHGELFSLCNDDRLLTRADLQSGNGVVHGIQAIVKGKIPASHVGDFDAKTNTYKFLPFPCDTVNIPESDEVILIKFR